MLLARDSIVGIFIPSSIPLPASLFTRSVIHHLVTNSLVICLQAYDVYYREGQRYLSDTRSDKSWSRSKPTQQTPSETLIEHLYNHLVTLWRLISHKVFSGMQELHNLIVIGTCISHAESNSRKLNDQSAKLTDGSCPSHHSPNDVIPFIKWQHMSMVRKLNHLWWTS